jgi:CheY-like chemotaxis protein
MGSILIADDHAPTRYLRARILNDAGYSVVEAGCARTTLDATRHGPPLSLVLLDVGLPDGDGFDVCSQIKATHPDLPVILISAVYRTAQARRGGLAAGADAYLVDPTPAARLLAQVRTLVAPAPADVPRPKAVIRTTSGGVIIWMNETAASLVNLSARAAQGRSVLPFFDGDRQRVQAELACATAGQVCEFEASVRPRDRKPVNVRVDLAVAPDGGPGELEWTIEQ